MARFLVIGNCQTDSVANCLRVLHPKGYVEGHNLWNLQVDFQNEDRLLTHLRTFDFVILQEFGGDNLGVLDSNVLRAASANALTIPGVVFSAFHPDIVYAQPKDPAVYGHRCVRSAIGEYQSALVVYGFLQGLGVEKTLALFRPDVYESVGYLTMWDESQTFLLNAFKTYGWKADEYFLQWARSGEFMYTNNHPKIAVFADIARMILKRCELTFEAHPFEKFLIDPLRNGPIWPVYPAVAGAYGLAGSMHFKRVEIGQGAQLFLNLEEFVAQSYAELEKVGANNVYCSRPQEWVHLGEVITKER